jgi:hypothetical protein
VLIRVYASERASDSRQAVGNVVPRALGEEDAARSAAALLTAWKVSNRLAGLGGVKELDLPLKMPGNAASKQPGGATTVHLHLTPAACWGNMAPPAGTTC